MKTFSIVVHRFQQLTFTKVGYGGIEGEFLGVEISCVMMVRSGQVGQDNGVMQFLSSTGERLNEEGEA